MKNFWKRICMGCLLVAAMFGFAGCKDNNIEVSVDLDGDGVISQWETIFEIAEPSTRVVTGADVVAISDLAGLKAINDSTETKRYVLTNNIDCGGEEVTIKLGSSSLYGNNYVIKNFKLGDLNLLNANEEVVNANIKTLIYGGNGVYDLRVFVGKQSYTLNTAENISIVSTLLDVHNIDNVVVKGFIDLERPRVDDLGVINIDMSLLASNTDILNIDNIKTPLNISNSEVVGKVKYYEDIDVIPASIRIGSIVPTITKNSKLFQSNASVDIDAVVNGDISIGMIAGENNGTISTCNSTGNLNLKYLPCDEIRVGGIVGSNKTLAEIKNCTTNASINFVNPENVLISGEPPKFFAGGITGVNEKGIVEYAVSDAIINVSDIKWAEIGGIAGHSENGIFNNIISRGKINVTNAEELYTAEMIGVSSKGLIKSCVVTTHINIDNSAIYSEVYVGMLTIFDDLGATEDDYSASNSPSLSGILLSGVNGSNEVYMKSGSEFSYNLGLRNTYEYLIDTEEDEDEEGESIDIKIYDTRFPDLFTNLCYLNDYKITKYEDVEGVKTAINLDLTYPKDSNNAPLVQEKADTIVYQSNFFIGTLGFRYGLNHNEIDLSDLTLSKIKFTLTDNLETGYFDKKTYNGEFAYFDRHIDSACTFDKTDEMFSLINYMISSNQENEYIPLVVSSKFIESRPLINDIPEDDGNEDMDEETNEDGSNSDQTLGRNDLFIDNMSRIFALMKMSVVAEELTDAKLSLDEDGQDNASIKYIRFTYSDAKYQYTFTFDISDMSDVLENEITQNNFIFYLRYTKTARI